MLASVLAAPLLAQGQTFMQADLQDADSDSVTREPSAYTLLAVREYATMATVSAVLPAQNTTTARFQPTSEPRDIVEHGREQHDAARRSSQHSGRISYTRYEDDVQLEEGSCVFSQNNFTYSCE